MSVSTKGKGIIFNIQRYSIHDGPGIRTLVFLKGCPLRCVWCSNPEGFSGALEIKYDKNRCIGCGACIKACDQGAIVYNEVSGYLINRIKCNNCGNCAKFCPSDAKSILGEISTAQEIVAKIKRDAVFYKQNGGGVTVGGGELLYQPEFAYEIVRLCKQSGINTAIETSGLGSWEWLEKIVECCDTIHYDIKAVDSNKHKILTGADNSIILENLKRLDLKLGNMAKDKRPRLIIRVPAVPGYNASTEDFAKLGRFIKENIKHCAAVDVLPFHNFGEQKYEQLGLPYLLAGISNAKAEEFTELIRVLEDMGIPTTLTTW